MFTTKKRSRSILIAMIFLLSISSYAQDDAVDEIVVTADYRGRPAADIPTSITLLDAETISGTAIQHFEELIGGLANLNWSGDGHRARYIQIRGVGERSQYQ
ncbi:MAG: hypothetical protein QGF87_08295, partial [Woeseiaceae bacterium]|nr:hypothetical protein [Woeseiaceae bacterium]